MPRRKEFNEQTVLEEAVQVFWKQGYEKTSIQDLVDCMGIHRRSIYDTFGDKHSLFLKALDYYEEKINTLINNGLNEDMSTKYSIQYMFEIVTRLDNSYPKGCLIVNSAVELSLIDDEIAIKINGMFKRAEERILSLLTKGQERGEISKATNINELVSFIHNSLIGVRVLAKTTNDKDELDSIIKLTLSIIK